MGSSVSVSQKNIKSSILSVALESFNQNRKDFEQVEHDVRDEVGFIKVISDYPSVLFDLLVLISQKHIQSQWISDWNAFLEKSLINILDDGKIEQLHLEGVDQDRVDAFRQAHTPNHLSAVIAECQGITSLGWLNKFFTDEAIALVVLNVPSNQLTEQSLTESEIQQSTKLVQLNIGGNNFSNITELLPHLPSCLLILDISYTEDLKFSPGVFLSCPQLLQLSLDGCGLVSTTFDDPPIGEAGDVTSVDSTDGTKLERMCKESIFFGLISLMNLSIKENRLETLHSFQGLSFFSYQKSTLSQQSETIQLPAIDCCLQHLSIADNPLCEMESEHRNLCTWVRASLPSVCTIDEKALIQAPLQAVDHTSAEYRAAHDQQATISGANISDSQEREFSAALRGEQDVSVVA